MIGHYLLTLTPEQEDRVLTTPFGHHLGDEHFGGGAAACLVMTVHRATGWVGAIEAMSVCAMEHATDCDGTPLHWHSPAIRYDALGLRFGEDRVNAAIRNRILSNKARRELVGVRETAHA
jgi:hypothetical protein